MPLVRNGSGVVHEVPEGHWAIGHSDFVSVPPPAPPPPPPDPELPPGPEPETDKPIEALTVRELREIADERGVDHAGLRKAELVRALS